ncbi:MAG TPA: DUF5343 domain-containing protein [Verrucomicrobiae bacterium]|nr:DUF5343 domain-containing protein [Verrucomicrobiae bacterium]
MPLMNSYLVTTKNLEAFFNAILSAKAPEVFSNRFLQQLEFKSTNDRLFIGLLKGLGFLDETSKPTARYFDFLDQTRSKVVLAEAISEAYDDLFQVNKKAHELSANEVKNKLKTLTQGQKSDLVLTLMANTFRALCDWADWSTTSATKPSVPTELDAKKTPKTKVEIPDSSGKGTSPQLHYNIQIHLPESRDPAVYDAIFRSLREHLL